MTSVKDNIKFEVVDNEIPFPGKSSGHVQPGYVQPGSVQPGYVQPGSVQPGHAQSSGPTIQENTNMNSGMKPKKKRKFIQTL